MSRTLDHTVVEAVFHDRDELSAGVQALFEKNIPADSVQVFVRDASGARGRRVPVQDEPGALNGAVGGAGAGALVGLLVAVVAALGVGPMEPGPFGPVAISRALAATVVGAAAGVPIGAILGMGYWQGRTRIAARGMGESGAVVVVETNDLAELAESTLRHTGATRVEVY